MRLLRLLLVLFITILMGVSNAAVAQITYLSSSSQNAGSPGGTTFSETSTTGWTDVGIAGTISANVWSPTITLPFAFNFYGTPVTECKVSANGLLTFTTSVTGTPPNANGTLPDASLPNNTIAVMWDEFTSAAPTGSNDKVYHFTTGTAPNRQFWVYWFSFEYGNPNVSFQYFGAVLEETTNNVYVVDVYGSATPLLTTTVGVQKDATTAVQFGSNVAQNGNGSANADNDYYAFMPVLLVNDNAGIASIDAPVSPLSTGSQNVNVTLKNHGLNALTSATINWKVNGTLQAPYSYTGNLAQDATASVTLGTHNFTAGTTNIEAWSSMPNGVADNDVSNDTSMVSLCTSLSGTYTVGASGDYVDVAAAVAALNSCGVSGPVTFNVAAGTYTGAISLGAVIGTNATNTITFNGASAATTTITHDGTGQYSTILLDGADYVTFQNLTIANTGTSNAWGVHLMNQADNNTIDNCIISLDQTVTASSLVGVLSSSSTTSTSGYGDNANNTTISNTTINGGYYGVRYNGNSTASAYNVNNAVENCTFTNIYLYSVYWIYQEAPSVKGCTINAHRSTGYAVYSTTNRHMLVEGNTIAPNGYTYAVYFTSSNGTSQNATARASIINNMIGVTGTGDGIYITGSSNFDIFYNSVTAENDQALWLTTSALGYDIRNNIFAASGAAPIDFDAAPTATDVVNYNVYYNSGGGNIADIAAASYLDAAAWVAADPTQNANSLTGDPSFLSPTNLHLAGTIANDAGTPIAGITTDIDGDARSATTPDIGADEYTPPSCSPPGALNIATLSSSSAGLAWTAGGTETMWDVEYGTAGFTQGAGTLVTGTTSNPYTATMLTPNTAYEFYVRANCGGGNGVSPWIGPFSFSTPCVAYTVPYFEGFETGYTHNTAVAGCLSQESVVGTQVWTANNTFTDYNRAPYAGAWNAFLRYSNDDWLYIPIDLTAGTSYTFECYARQDGATAANSDVAVSYGTANNAAAMTNTIVAATGIINGAYQQITGSFTPTTTGTYYIGIKGFMNGTPWYISLDNISVITTPNCPAPNALTASNVTATSADVAWAGTSAAYEVQYGAAGFTPGTGMTVTSTTTTASLTGLTFETNYDFYVRAVCAPGDTSPWSGAGSFFTGYCTPAPTSVDGSGITNVTMGGVNNTTGAEPGNYADYSAQVANAQQGVTLPIDITYATGYTYNTWAWIDWNNDLDFTDAGEAYYLGESSNANPTTFSSSIAIPVTAAIGNYRIRIGGADSGLGTTAPSLPCYTGAYGTFEDYTLSVAAAPSCLPVSALTVSNTTATSASLGWTENGTATAWDIEWGAAGFTQGTGTLVTATATNPYALSGLSANTAYAYYVRANCGSSTSAWTGPFTFTTPCVAFTVPYFEGFETGYTHNTAVAGCLSQQSITGTAVWTANNTLTTYNRAPYAGAWNAFLQWSNDDWLFIPIDLTGGTSYTFECYARQDGATAANSDVAVSYGTANNAAAMTNTIVAATGIVNGAYQQLTGSFTPATTGTYYIGIKGFMNGTPWYISLDNISVITTPNCPAPNALTASNITATSADVAWAGTSAAYEVQYGAAGFTPGTGMTVTSTTTTASLTSLTFETNYNFYVRAVCAPGDTSPWSGAGSFFTGYCTPAPTSVDLQGITNVSMGGVNNTTVAEPGNYGNYSAQVANAPQGGTLAIDVTYQTGFTYDTWAWVDWNNDLDFTDAGEEYYLGNSTTANPTTLSGSITIPATALGNYRIRIGGSDTGLPTSPANPCYSGSYGAFEDYTLSVMPALEPFALLAPANNAYVVVAGPAQNPIDISWESAGSVAAMYEWRANITGGSLNTPAVTLPSDNMGMDTTLSLNVQAVDDLLASFGVAIGDTAVLDWSVVAYSAGGDSLFATMPYTVNLVRLGVSSPLLLNAPQNTNSTTTLRAPNGSASHTYMRAATVVLPTEFATAGIAANTTIRNFGFNTNVPIPAGSVTGVFKLYLQNTTDVTYGKGTAWAGITPGMTEVFNDTITINGGGNGWDVVLDTLFAYAGNSVYVAYDWQLVANPLGTAISYYANTALASGLVSASSTTAPPTTLAGSSFRPEFAWGIDRDADDLEVVALYAMGKNPLGYSEPEQVQAIVRNNGYLPANKTITLNITGANPYTTSENVTLAPGQETVVAFMAYNPTTAGFNNMTVSVPADQVALNDTKSWVQETTTNTFAYADSTLTGLGGVGYNTASGLLLNRYYVNGAASISEIKVRIANNAATAGNAVYAVLMDTSGAIVSQSAPYTVTAADLGTVVTFTLGTTVNVADVDVLVGLAQPANATGYFPVAYQGETPTRPGAYFGADLNGANLGAVNGFRLMIEAVVGPACVATSSVAVTNANCFGDASGEITVSVIGGTAPFNYLWNNGQTNATATGLVAAIYDVTITDANGCSLVATGTVGQPSAIVLTTSSVSDTSSAGVGTASVVATGGTAPYTYLWSNGQTADVATGLTPATYTVTITDANNCTATETVTVDNYTSTTRIDYVTNVSIYPNPTSGNTVIDLELSQNAEVAVSIYTVTGVLVQDFGKENTSKATHIIDVTEYPAGMYLVRFVVDNQVITKKLLVAK